MYGRDSLLFLELMEKAVFPSVLFLLTSCVICLWIGVIAGTYMKQSQFKLESSKHEEKSELHPELKHPSTHPLQLGKPPKVPKHIAVIMDGNRRFGRIKHSDSLQGHWAGGQKLIDFVQWCIADGVKILTVYAFSTENWNRDPVEVSALMNIFVKHASTLKTEAVAKNIRVKVFATSMEKLPEDVLTAVKELEIATELQTQFQLNVCLSYGSREEIVQACKSVVKTVRNHNLSEDVIDEDMFAKHLLTANVQDPDLLIRTSGEYRLSNFLLYQMAYTEMFFVNKYWPELTQDDLRDVMHRFSQRDRRYGAG